MTYAAFLLQFLVVPILILGVVVYRSHRRSELSRGVFSPLFAAGVLAVIAVVYTTPWDNYLVATGVWSYDRALVLGITLGWVPLEEYLFFVLQTALVSLWFVLLAPRLTPTTSFTPQNDVRLLGTLVLGIVWVTSLALLLIDWQPARYISLVLVWALPPLALQVALGGDILWHYRRLVVITIASMTLYLSAMDTFALRNGTWVINPNFTLGISVGNILPIEEAVFFLVTCSLLTLGLTLGSAPQMLDRLPASIRDRVIGRSWQSSP